MLTIAQGAYLVTTMKTYLDIEEVEALEKAAQYLRDRLLIRMLCRTGCRVSEALGLSVDDVDFATGTVRIVHLKASMKLHCPQCGGRLSRSARFCPGCGGRVEQTVAEAGEQRRLRTLPVDRETLQLLREYLEQGGAISRNGRRLLFGINRHRAWQIVKDCAQRAKLGHLVNPETGRRHHVSPHRLRDAFAVNAVKKDDSGDGLRLLQEHLGHQSIVTTMRYRKLSGEEQRQWYERLWNRGA
jgi:integrase/recombinase XerD